MGRPCILPIRPPGQHSPVAAGQRPWWMADWPSVGLPSGILVTRREDDFRPCSESGTKSRNAAVEGDQVAASLHHGTRFCWGVTKCKKVGVVGLGGLGHMGVKFADALGAHVVVFTTSRSKKEDALRLGADEGWPLEES